MKKKTVIFSKTRDECHSHSQNGNTLLCGGNSEKHQMCVSVKDLLISRRNGRYLVSQNTKDPAVRRTEYEESKGEICCDQRPEHKEYTHQNGTKRSQR